MPDKFNKKPADKKKTPAKKKPAAKKAAAKKTPAKKTAAKKAASKAPAKKKTPAPAKNAAAKPVEETKVNEDTAPKEEATPVQEPETAAEEQPAAEAPQEEPKSFKENLSATLEEEQPGAAVASGSMEDVPVEDLLDGLQSVLGDVAGEVKQAVDGIKLPEIKLPDGLASRFEGQPGDIQVESLGEGIADLFKGTFAEGVVSDITGTITDVTDKVTETVNGAVDKIKRG